MQTILEAVLQQQRVSYRKETNSISYLHLSQGISKLPSTW